MAQKLGLFHNQNFFRPAMKPLSCYIGETGQVDGLLTYRAPPASYASRSTTKPTGSLSDFQEIFKSARPTWSAAAAAGGYGSQLELAGRQIAAIAAAESRVLQQRLYSMWQSRGENETYTEDLLRYFKARARLLHYVFTPLLFLPLWRWKANATRDQNHESPVGQQDGLPAAEAVAGGGPKRSRHESGADSRQRRSHSVTSQNHSAVSLLAVGQSPEVAPPLLKASSEQFHADLIANFIQENVQYLQTLGFQLIEMSLAPAASRRARRPSAVEKPSERMRKMTSSGGSSSSNTAAAATAARSRARSSQHVVYLQKSLLGGILIFEMGVSEPFFYAKLHALEAQRLQPRTSQLSMQNKNFTTTFLEECDKIKILIHMHSFTYDYHLRTISSYVSLRPTRLRPGFHVVSFLEDFLKYYTKGPNFARNFIYSGSLHVISQVRYP